MNKKDKLTKEEKIQLALELAVEYDDKELKFLIECLKMEEEYKCYNLTNIILMLNLTDYYRKNGITRKEAERLCKKYKYECVEDISYHEDGDYSLGHTTGGKIERIIERKTGKIIKKSETFID